jgi:hypothetical protein
MTGPRCPGRGDLARAHDVFRAHESRDLFYRAAIALVTLAKAGTVDLTVGEALAVLLRTWNSAYYRFHPPGAGHYAEVEALIETHGAWLENAAQRRIVSLADADQQSLSAVFTSFETVLGPVGAAKALHLLAPRFMPLWDRKIAAAYIGPLGPAGTNAGRYLRFMQATREQSIELGGDSASAGRNILKALDEYNYCVLTRKWMMA